MVNAQQLSLKTLIKMPNVFWGASENEILKLVHHPGSGRIPHGQFSLIDEDQEAVYLIRDRLGLNKLFYCLNAETKTLTVGNYLVELVRETADKEKVVSVPAGHYVRIDKTTLEKKLCSYYDISTQTEELKAFDVASFQKKVSQTLTNGFRFLNESYKDSDYFVCLSGGLDSTIILNYAKQLLSDRVTAVTYSYASRETIRQLGHVVIDPPPKLLLDKVLSEDLHRAHRLAQMVNVPFMAVLVEKQLDPAQLDEVIASGQDWRDFNVHCAWVNFNIARYVRELFPRRSIIFLTGDLMNEFVADYAAVNYKGTVYYPQPRITKDRLRKFFIYGLDAGDREIGIFHAQKTRIIQPYALVAENYRQVPGDFLNDPGAKQKLNAALLFDKNLLKEVSAKKFRSQVGGEDGGTLGLFHDAGITENILKERWVSLLSKTGDTEEQKASWLKIIHAGRYRH